MKWLIFHTICIREKRNSLWWIIKPPRVSEVLCILYAIEIIRHTKSQDYMTNNQGKKTNNRGGPTDDWILTGKILKIWLVHWKIRKKMNKKYKDGEVYKKSWNL